MLRRKQLLRFALNDDLRDQKSNGGGATFS